MSLLKLMQAASTTSPWEQLSQMLPPATALCTGPGGQLIDITQASSKSHTISSSTAADGAVNQTSHLASVPKSLANSSASDDSTAANLPDHILNANMWDISNKNAISERLIFVPFKNDVSVDAVSKVVLATVIPANGQPLFSAATPTEYKVAARFAIDCLSFLTPSATFLAAQTSESLSVVENLRAAFKQATAKKGNFTTNIALNKKFHAWARQFKEVYPEEIALLIRHQLQPLHIACVAIAEASMGPIVLSAVNGIDRAEPSVSRSHLKKHLTFCQYHPRLRSYPRPCVRVTDPCDSDDEADADAEDQLPVSTASIAAPVSRSVSTAIHKATIAGVSADIRRDTIKPVHRVNTNDIGISPLSPPIVNFSRPGKTTISFMDVPWVLVLVGVKVDEIQHSIKFTWTSVAALQDMLHDRWPEGLVKFELNRLRAQKLAEEWVRSIRERGAASGMRRAFAGANCEWSDSDAEAEESSMSLRIFAELTPQQRKWYDHVEYTVQCPPEFVDLQFGYHETSSEAHCITGNRLDWMRTIKEIKLDSFMSDQSSTVDPLFSLIFGRKPRVGTSSAAELGGAGSSSFASSTSAHRVITNPKLQAAVAAALARTDQATVSNQNSASAVLVGSKKKHSSSDAELDSAGGPLPKMPRSTLFPIETMGDRKVFDFDGRNLVFQAGDTRFPMSQYSMSNFVVQPSLSAAELKVQCAAGCGFGDRSPKVRWSKCQTCSRHFCTSCVAGVPTVGRGKTLIPFMCPVCVVCFHCFDLLPEDESAVSGCQFGTCQYRFCNQTSCASRHQCFDNKQ